MKTEIKRIPITYNGEDGFEVLYEDTAVYQSDACNYCMYNEWFDWLDNVVTCAEAHGCGLGKRTYFQFIK